MYSVGDTFFLMEAILYIPSGLAFRTVFCGSCIRSILYRLCQYHPHRIFAKMADGVYFISNEDEPGPRAAQHIYGESAGKVRFLIRFIGQ